MPLPSDIKFRVWWVPQIPCPSFEFEVPSLEEGRRLCDALGKYDAFQYANKIKPDYCNCGGISYWHPVHTEGVWWDWPDDEDEVAELMREFGESTADGSEHVEGWLNDQRTSTLYQVVGSLADAAGVFDDPAVIRALDLATDGKTEDGSDVLPFLPNYPAQRPTPSREEVAVAISQAPFPSKASLAKADRVLALLRVG